MQPRKTTPEVPRGRRGQKLAPGETSQATAREFEREGMGLAPKE